MSSDAEGAAMGEDYSDGEDYYADYNVQTNNTYDYDNYSSVQYTNPDADEAVATSALTNSAGEAQTYVEFKVAQMLWVYAGSAIIAAGTVGHVMSVLVLLGSRRMRLLSLSVYLVATSLAGLASLYVGLLRQVVLHESNNEIDVRDHLSDGGCRLHAALTYMTLQLYLWLQATIAVERSIAVFRPMHYKRWCTWRRNLVVVASIVVLLGLFNTIVAFVYGIDPNGYCIESPDQKELFQVVWGYVDLVLYSIFPVAVIVPCNGLTLHAIYRSRVDSQPQQAAAGRRYTQLTVMLVAHNCVCVATTLPISVIFLLPWPTDRYSAENARRELEWTAFSLLQYLGMTFSFVIYSTSAQRFRRAVADLFGRGFNASKTSTTGFSSSCKNSSSGSRTMRVHLQRLERTAAGGGDRGASGGHSGSGSGSGCGGNGVVSLDEQEHAC